MKIHGRALNDATIWSMIFVTGITIFAELIAPLKTFLASITGHHWVTKSVFAIILFVVVYFIISKKTLDHTDIERVSTDIWQTVIITIICSILLLSFFTWHFFA